MKTQSIPAQITTVEDKIAGNLSFTQIVLLMVPIFWLMLIYTILPPYMHFSLYKFPLLFIVGLVSLGLAIRIKDKIVLNWLVILLKYNLRPRYYLFNKNDTSMRTMSLITIKSDKRRVKTKSQTKVTEKASNTSISLGELVKLEGLLSDPQYSFSVKSQKKGALHVAFEQNKK